MQQYIDEYQNVCKQIETLESVKEALAQRIKQAGPATYFGTHCTAIVSEVNGRKTTDWKEVCKLAQVPELIVEACTKQGEKSLRLSLKLWYTAPQSIPLTT
jgi:hypothetical protein